ncbi:dihydroorotate dehydrogenase [Candidatus Bathyarchaeota archaeon]|nr:dihydroorotate dehydrogenase [Candidatus Bathyarchaeota archaeon]
MDSKINISSQIGKLELRNPFILASGTLGISGTMLKHIAQEGAGAVVTKSFSLNAREGYPGPVMTEVTGGFLNSMGLPNPGAEAMKTEIQEAKKSGIPIIASIFGFNEDEYAQAASFADKAKADALELNVSCPHVEQVGVEIGLNPELLKKVTSAVKKSFQGPIIVKLSPNAQDVVEIAEAAANAGANALTVSNTMKGIAIDIETRRPILGGKFGGLSGPALKPIALRCVFQIYEKIALPIIGCGGITCCRDVIEFLLAGASAVQIGTAIVYNDIGVFKELAEDLICYMSKHNNQKLEELIGTAHV